MKNWREEMESRKDTEVIPPNKSKSNSYKEVL
jgi:hypothetical protein